MKKTILSFGVMFVMFLSIPMVSASGPDGSDVKYRRSIMNIFNGHLVALRHIGTGTSRYADNIIRHAKAIRSTSQLLDHAFTQPSGTTNADGVVPPVVVTDQKQFHRLVQASQKAANNLVRAAKEQVRTKDYAPFNKALVDMQQACKNCHRVF